MDREIRRKDRALPEDEMLRILEVGQYGILSTVGEAGMACRSVMFTRMARSIFMQQPPDISWTTSAILFR
jgi:hypothetical protein